MCSRQTIIACALLLGACGGDGGNSGPHFDDDDAGPDQFCWPELDPIQRGTVELGAGDAEFSPLPETLPMFYGLQGGFGMMVRTRMSGFSPGEERITAPGNPFTRVRATLVDSTAALTLPSDCGFRDYYVPNDVGGYDLHDPIAIVFNTCWGSDMLVGAKIQIDVELMDATGSYAKDTSIVTAAETMDPTYRDIATGPDCGL